MQNTTTHENAMKQKGLTQLSWLIDIIVRDCSHETATKTQQNPKTKKAKTPHVNMQNAEPPNAKNGERGTKNRNAKTPHLDLLSTTSWTVSPKSQTLNPKP